MKTNLIIRKENPKDYKEIYELVKTAFKDAEHTDGDEQNLVERLRKSDAYIPELSLIAKCDGKIAGYIMFTLITIGEETAVTIAPLAVMPEMQGRGVGGALIKEGHRIAKDMGYEFSVLVGHAKYYPRFGYLPASRFGIKSAIDVPDENFMVCNLKGSQRKLDGTVKYAKEFFEN